VVNVVEGDDRVSAPEAADGVDITGTAEPGSAVTANWSNLAARSANVAADGSWTISFLANELPGFGPADLSVVATANSLTGDPAVRTVTMENTPPASAISVLAFGDSLTKGDEQNENTMPPQTSFRSYRGTFQTLLTNAGYQFDIVGPQSNVPDAGGSDPDHAGYGGAMITAFTASDPVSAQCLTDSQTPTVDGGSNGNMADRVNSVLASTGTPDLVIVASLGWNSLFCDPTSVSADQMSALMTQLTTALPNTQFLIGTVTPTQGQTETQTNASASGYENLNTRIRQIAAGDNRIYLADLAAISFESSDYFDSIHWLQPAADKVAQELVNRITSEISFP
jgi:hypothetical protein